MKVSVPYSGKLSFLQMCKLVVEYIREAREQYANLSGNCTIAMDGIETAVSDGKYLRKETVLPESDSENTWMHYQKDIRQEIAESSKDNARAWFIDEYFDQLIWQLWLCSIEAVERGECQVRHAQRFAMIDNVYRRQKLVERNQ